jgi:thiamine kinase-like enzyme
MRGEVYWYKNIPKQLAGFFPSVLSVDGGETGRGVSIVMSKIEGVTYSQLIVSGAVTTGRLKLLLDSLHKIHRCQHNPDTSETSLSAAAANPNSSPVLRACATNIEIPPVASELEQNYGPKVRSRYEKHKELYMSFLADVPEIETMFGAISEFLDKYISEERFRVASFIHGDPVLSNILLEKRGGVKFIDMRGALGDRLTTAGDINYDLSKLFQSLNGYDYMLLDFYEDINTLQKNSLTKLQNIFWEAIRENYAQNDESDFLGLKRDITLLTAAHFFTIVPLHETRQRQLLYLQQSKKLLRDCQIL